MAGHHVAILANAHSHHMPWKPLNRNSESCPLKSYWVGEEEKLKKVKMPPILHYSPLHCIVACHPLVLCLVAFCKEASSIQEHILQDFFVLVFGAYYVVAGTIPPTDVISFLHLCCCRRRGRGCKKLFSLVLPRCVGDCKCARVHSAQWLVLWSLEVY